jgi:hypothetical protein
LKLPGKTAWFALFLIFTAGIFPLSAQTAAGTISVEEIQFPQWSKDLRRGEIIAFGTIPFSWIVSSVTVDIFRTIEHNGDQRYLPWPLKPAGAPAMTSSEFLTTIVLALSISALAAIADHIIIKYKRKKAEDMRLANPPREPVIIRHLVGDSGADVGAGAGTGADAGVSADVGAGVDADAEAGAGIDSDYAE